MAAPLTRMATMRLQGRLSDWDDQRGFGYITPNGGGERAWMHISAWQGRGTRPADGDQLTYQVKTNPKGRPTAVAVKPARSTARPRNSVHKGQLGKGSQAWRVIGGLFVLSAQATAGALGLLPWWLVAAALGLSMLTWAAYGLDKRAARQDQRRTPEATLQLLGLLGGWPGALIAQGQFRHKTAKFNFQALYWVCVVLNLLAGLALIGKLPLPV